MLAFHGGFNAWMVKINAKAVARYRAYGRNIFNYIVMETPQWTGGTAASWKFGVGAVSTEGPNYLPDTDMPYVKARRGYGNAAALTIAFAEVEKNAAKITSLSQGIFISNAAEFTRGNKPEAATGNYVAKEAARSGNSWLREVNRPGDAANQAASYARTYNWYKGGGLIHEF